MINDAWTSEINQGWINLTYLKTNSSVMINLKDMLKITEDILQGLYEDVLTDKDVMLAFRIFRNYARNR